MHFIYFSLDVEFLSNNLVHDVGSAKKLFLSRKRRGIRDFANSDRDAKTRDMSFCGVEYLRCNAKRCTSFVSVLISTFVGLLSTKTIFSAHPLRFILTTHLFFCMKIWSYFFVKSGRVLLVSLLYKVQCPFPCDACINQNQTLIRVRFESNTI